MSLTAAWLDDRVELSIFRLKRYLVFLELFLQTAEKHFMVGHRITYYVFTDQLVAVPRVPLWEGQRVVVFEVRGVLHWQDVSMRHIAMISRFCEQRFLCDVDDLVCVDVDVGMKFWDHMGMEILSPLFGSPHPGFYWAGHEDFSYERWPQSQTHIPRDQGNFHYMGAFFGELVVEVPRLTLACHQAMVVNWANGIEAVWPDKSHLNRYLLDHRPTKVLSPEDLWDPRLLGWPPLMKKLRFVAVPKNHQDIWKSRGAAPVSIRGILATAGTDFDLRTLRAVRFSGP
uniref:histo-blood group ABO system transferase-like n=1 Tax=Odobenus rosmarus divergens TaxID=9708 RepID=UPI00063C6D12|nr:PREDICTED: histo-blood group ABO system transferase-like [Odobenus rosmarus divergens]